VQFSKQVTYAGMSTAGKSIGIIINEQSNKYANSYESIIMVYLHGGSLKITLTVPLKSHPVRFILYSVQSVHIVNVKTVFFTLFKILRLYLFNTRDVMMCVNTILNSKDCI